MYSFLRDNWRPNQKQNLLISQSKHLYLTKGGNLRYQDKPIDPRLPGAKTLLTRLVLLDVDTGTVYGEMHTDDTAGDLVGFLARAWHPKPHHPLHGLPALLNLPKSGMVNPDFRSAIAMVEDVFGVALGDLPPGFNAGIHAVKNFEKEVISLAYRYRWELNVTDVPMDFVQASSDFISRTASTRMSLLLDEAWAAVPQIAPEVFARVDALYESHGAWRGWPFSRMFSEG